MEIKRYKIKSGTKEKDLKKAGAEKGGTWVNKDATLYINEYVEIRNSDINIDVCFKKDIKDWNDQDNVLVTDSDSGQKYFGFYQRLRGNTKYGDNKFVDEFVEKYNAFMDSLPFLKEIKDGKVD